MAATRPVLLFIDEIDALCPKRDANAAHENRVVAQLLTLMDGMMVRRSLLAMGVYASACEGCICVYQ